MKPFNLQEALAGKPVVDSTGSPVTDFHYFANSTEKQKLYGVDSEGLVFAYTDNGRFFADEEKGPGDLFMASEKKEGWVNVYTDKTWITGTVSGERDAYTYLTKEAADSAAGTARVACVRIEWEE